MSGVTTNVPLQSFLAVARDATDEKRENILIALAVDYPGVPKSILAFSKHTDVAADAKLRVAVAERLFFSRFGFSPVYLSPAASRELVEGWETLLDPPLASPPAPAPFEEKIEKSFVIFFSPQVVLDALPAAAASPPAPLPDPLQPPAASPAPAAPAAAPPPLPSTPLSAEYSPAVASSSTSPATPSTVAERVSIALEHRKPAVLAQVDRLAEREEIRALLAGGDFPKELLDQIRSAVAALDLGTVAHNRPLAPLPETVARAYYLSADAVSKLFPIPDIDPDIFVLTQNQRKTLSQLDTRSVDERRDALILLILGSIDSIADQDLFNSLSGMRATLWQQLVHRSLERVRSTVVSRTNLTVNSQLQSVLNAPETSLSRDPHWAASVDRATGFLKSLKSAAAPEPKPNADKKPASASAKKVPTAKPPAATAAPAWPQQQQQQQQQFAQQQYGMSPYAAPWTPPPPQQQQQQQPPQSPAYASSAYAGPWAQPAGWPAAWPAQQASPAHAGGGGGGRGRGRGRGRQQK